VSKKIEIHQPHDKLFKVAFGHKEVLKDFLKSRLTPEILAKVDLTTAKLENCSFVSEELRGTQSDIVYSVQIDGKKGYIYTLIEHQSEVDGKQPMRLLGYNVQLWCQHIKQHGSDKYPAIINLVLYTGTKVYKGATSIAEAFDDPQLFYKSLGTPFLINVKDESDSKILKDGKATLLEFLLRQGKARKFRKFLKENPHIVALIRESLYVVEVMLYIFARDNSTPKEMLKKVPNLDEETKDRIMSGLEQMIQQGRQEGVQLGERKGRQEGIQLGERRGKKEGIMELLKMGAITKAQAEEVLKSKQSSDEN